MKRQALQCTDKYKASRSNKQYLKYAETHTDKLEENKSGAKYETGVAVNVAKKGTKICTEKKPAGYLTC